MTIDDVTLPGEAEMIVDVFLDWPEEVVEWEACMLVDSVPELDDKYGCVLTPVAVDVTRKVMTQVRLMNPFPSPVTIPRDECIGALMDGTISKVVMNEEDPWEISNNCTVR